MASPNNPPSSRELILKHSHARVVKPSGKRFVVRVCPLTGPVFSRPLNDLDAKMQMVRQFA